MIPKQDRQGVRHAKEIEQKYDLNQDFSSIEQMASNAQRAAEQANNKANSAVNATNKVAQSVGELSGSVANNTESLADLDKRVDALEKSGGGGSGTPGEDGATFTPFVDSNGNLSWTNDKGLENPATVNIKGADATINGVNTLGIVAGDNIGLQQQGDTLTISATGGGGGMSEITITSEVPEGVNAWIDPDDDPDTGGMQMDLLWENASPASGFASQRVLLNLTPYQLIVIRFAITLSDGYQTVLAVRGKEMIANALCNISLGNGGIGASRYINTNEQQVWFDPGKYYQASKMITEDNNAMIPVEIYGIKGVQ